MHSFFSPSSYSWENSSDTLSSIIMKTLFRFERGCDGFLSSSRLVRASLLKAPFVVLYSQRKEWKGGYNLVCHECSSCVHQVITMNLETWSEIVKWRIFLLSFFWAAVVVGCYFSVEHWFVVCLKAWGQMSIGEEEVEKKKKKNPWINGKRRFKLF